MTAAQLISRQHEHIEHLRIKSARLKKGYEISFCQIQKKRIAWDHYVNENIKRKAQSDYVATIDTLVPDKEIRFFLKSQNLPIQL